MGGNNPFIRYKIYSTSSALATDYDPPKSGVRVICYLRPEEKHLVPFLHKVLSAAEISENEFHLLFVHPEEEVSASDQGWLGKVPYIFLIGVPASSAGIRMNGSAYAVHDLAGSKIVHLPALSRIEPNRDQKQKLWTLLKNEMVHA